MSFGNCLDDARLLAAWKAFCRDLECAGEDAFKDTNPALPLHRADAFRFLTQSLGQGFDLAYERRDPRYPVIHAFCKPFVKKALGVWATKLRRGFLEMPVRLASTIFQARSGERQ